MKSKKEKKSSNTRQSAGGLCAPKGGTRDDHHFRVDERDKTNQAHTGNLLLSLPEAGHLVPLARNRVGIVLRHKNCPIHLEELSGVFRLRRCHPPGLAALSETLLPRHQGRDRSGIGGKAAQAEERNPAQVSSHAACR